MIPVALRIRHFKSFIKEQVFQFPREPGLYFMAGINETEPRLEANGTGKSSVWDALLWCLYERTARGLRAGDVANWEVGKDVEVAFDFIDDTPDCLWTITRTWKPNSWRLSHVAEFVTDEAVIDLAKDPANPVLAAVRLEFEPFLQSILMAQGREMFLDLKQEPQARLFSGVLGLDQWMEHAAKASKKASTQDGISRDLERRLARVEGELANLGKTDFSKSSGEWAADRERRLSALAVDHEKLCAKRKALKRELEGAQEREADARKARLAIEPPRGAKEHLEKLRDDLAESRELLAGLKGQAVGVREQLEATLELNGSCPTCGQDFQSQEHLNRHSDELLRKAKLLKEQISNEEAVELNLKGRLEEEEEGWDAYDEKDAFARKELDWATIDVGNARRALETCDRDLDRLEDRADEIEKERNPYEEMEADAQRAGRRLRDELDDLRERLDASESRYGLLSFWVRGFKELRLQEIAGALTELEIEVNSCVTALGLLDWELQFAVDKETKGGSVQRGFSVSVRNPHNPFATPWEAWSGGEGQRLRLAANMGLADLIRSRTGATLNLEVWDEPTQGLSGRGQDDLLESLAERARTKGRIIFIVDHKAHDFGGFAGRYTIVKAPSGSRIRQGAV